MKSPSEGADILDKLVSAAINDSDTEFQALIAEAYQLDARVTEETRDEPSGAQERKRKLKTEPTSTDDGQTPKDRMQE